MAQNMRFFLLLSLAILLYVQGFRPRHRSCSSANALHRSIQDEAIARGFKLSSSSNEPEAIESFPIPKKGEKLPWVLNPEPKSARERAQFKNKVPFSEEMYETVRRAIELLSERKNSGQSLSAEDAQWLKDAVELIIADAHKYGPPPRPPPRSPENNNNSNQAPAPSRG